MIDESFIRECANVYCVAYGQAFERSRSEALSIQAAAIVTQQYFNTFGHIEEKKIQAAETRAAIKILKDMKTQYINIKEHEGEESNKEENKKDSGKSVRKCSDINNMPEHPATD